MQIRAAIGTALGAAAAHAKLLADQEDRQIEHLMATIIGTQVYIVVLYYFSLVPLLCLCVFGPFCVRELIVMCFSPHLLQVLLAAYDVNPSSLFLA